MEHALLLAHIHTPIKLVQPRGDRATSLIRENRAWPPTKSNAEKREKGNDFIRNEARTLITSAKSLLTTKPYSCWKMVALLVTPFQEACRLVTSPLTWSAKKAVLVWLKIILWQLTDDSEGQGVKCNAGSFANQTVSKKVWGKLFVNWSLHTASHLTQLSGCGLCDLSFFSCSGQALRHAVRMKAEKTVPEY